MIDAVDQPHVNPPQQARSKKTLERIVRAALDILEKDGPDGLTVQTVVSKARSSVGSFYARFKGKEDLLEYLEARIWDETRERWQGELDRQPWAGQSGVEVADAAVRLLVAAHASRATYLKALDRMGAGGGDGYGSFRRLVLQRLTDAILAHAEEIEHPDPPLAVRLSLSAVYGVLEAGDPLTGDPFDPDVLTREGRRLLLRYLSAEGEPGPTDHGRPEAAVAPAAPEHDAGRLRTDTDTDADTAAQVTATEPDASPAPTPRPSADPDTNAEPHTNAEPDAGQGDDDEPVDFFDVWG